MDVLLEIQKWVVQVIETMGYPGLALVMFLENIFPPIPSEVILPLAGSLTLKGSFSLWGVTLVGAAGSTLGAWLFYGIGRFFGEAGCRTLIRRYGKWLMVRERSLDVAIAWFRRYGDVVILFGRMVPLVRSLISIPAGVARMSIGKFTLLTAFGTAAWSLALAWAGRLLGENWPRVSHFIDRYESLVVFVLATLVFAVLFRCLARAVESCVRSADKDKGV